MYIEMFQIKNLKLEKKTQNNGKMYQTNCSRCGTCSLMNKNMAHDTELQVMLGSQKATRKSRLSLDSLKFHFPLEHELNLTFRRTKS